MTGLAPPLAAWPQAASASGRAVRGTTKGSNRHAELPQRPPPAAGTAADAGNGRAAVPVAAGERGLPAPPALAGAGLRHARDRAGGRLPRHRHAAIHRGGDAEHRCPPRPPRRRRPGVGRLAVRKRLYRKPGRADPLGGDPARGGQGAASGCRSAVRAARARHRGAGHRPAARGTARRRPGRARCARPRAGAGRGRAAAHGRGLARRRDLGGRGAGAQPRPRPLRRPRQCRDRGLHGAAAGRDLRDHAPRQLLARRADRRSARAGGGRRSRGAGLQGTQQHRRCQHRRRHRPDERAAARRAQRPRRRRARASRKPRRGSNAPAPAPSTASPTA